MDKFLVYYLLDFFKSLKHRGSGPSAAREACHFLQGESPYLDKPKELFQ